MPTTFANLAVNTGTLLVETVAANNATITGTLANHGVIRKTQPIASTGLVNFGLTGVAMTVTVTGTLTSIQVDQVGANHPNANTQTATGRYWTIAPTGSSYVVDLTLPHNLTPDTNALVCRYTGSAWDCARTSSTASTVTRAGCTQLSDWAVGDASKQAIYSITIDRDHGGTLTYVDSQGLSTTIQIPAGAVSETTTLVYVPIESATPPANYAFAHHAFDLDAYRNDQLLTGFTFDQVVSVTVHYSHADVTGMNERTLKLYRWVPSVWEIVGTRPGEGQSLDTVNNVLTAWLRSLSRFGSMGASPGYDLFLPVVMRSE